MDDYKPGDRVVILFNPHHAHVVDVVAEVVRFERGTGFMGCDLVYLRYTDTRDGTVHELPFSTEKITRGDRESLLARAARHEEQAAALRRMADNL